MKWFNLTVVGRLIILTLLAFGLLLGLGAQDKLAAPVKNLNEGTNIAAKDVFKPTEIQSLRLQVKQRDALLAKAALEQAQRQFQQALTDLTSEGERVKQENGWAKDTQFQPNDLTFSAAPAPVKKDK